MAERSSELDQDTFGNRSTTGKLEDGDTALSDSGAFATTSVGEYTGDNSDVRTLSTTDTDAVVDSNAEPEEIKAQIEHTRSEMSETINAIQEKLSISNITEQVKEEVTGQISGAYESVKTAIFDATAGKMGDFMAKVNKGINRFSEDYGPAIGEAGTTVVRAAKTNPLPFALIGTGLTILLLSNRKKSYKVNKVRSYRYENEGADDFEYNTRSTRGRRNYGSSDRGQESSMSTAYNRAGNVAGQAIEGVSGAANSAYQGVTSAASTAYQGVGSAASTAYEGVSTGVSSIGTGAKQAARWTQETYERQLEENPFAIGAVALALGAIVGLMLPTTEIEGQYMGEYRENLIQQAQDAAGDLITKAQNVASEVTETVKEEAKAQGLTA
jgi:ElaB/YqjD/DUF883 family membrane-anchored ribosome-binding protein